MQIETYSEIRITRESASLSIPNISYNEFSTTNYLTGNYLGYLPGEGASHRYLVSIFSTQSEGHEIDSRRDVVFVLKGDILLHIAPIQSNGKKRLHLYFNRSDLSHCVKLNTVEDYFKGTRIYRVLSHLHFIFTNKLFH